MELVSWQGLKVTSLLSKSQEATEDRKDGKKEKQREASRNSADISSFPSRSKMSAQKGLREAPTSRRRRCPADDGAVAKQPGAPERCSHRGKHRAASPSAQAWAGPRSGRGQPWGLDPHSPRSKYESLGLRVWKRWEGEMANSHLWKFFKILQR